MEARGPLMVEHRLIERMIGLIKDALKRLESENKVNPLFVESAVDFIRMYADRTHHGKEEDILFHELDKKDMSAEDRELMNELVEEHVFGRGTTRSLADANARYRGGEALALDDIAGKMKALTDLYPKHIEKEDRTFFPASRGYFTDGEERAMLDEFREFDRRMIHEKYRAAVAEFGG